MIPKVKQWRIVTQDGTAVIVLAPTRMLALLNFREFIGWMPIKSCGTVRKQRKEPRGQMAWKDNA